MKGDLAVVYHRVSGSDQDPFLARQELRRAAKVRGLAIVEEIEETGSGARNDRPGLQRVMDLARSGSINVVVVWKLDRFGRSALDLLTNIEAINSFGATFIATTQGMQVKPGGDAISRLLLTMLAAVAEFERELIRERTLLGLQKAKDMGIRLGRRPRLSQLDRTRIAQLRDEGVPWPKVARRLGCSVSTAKRAFREVKKGVTADGGE